MAVTSKTPVSVSSDSWSVLITRSAPVARTCSTSGVCAAPDLVEQPQRERLMITSAPPGRPVPDQAAGTTLWLIRNRLAGS